MVTAKQHKEYVRRYRGQASKHRLELMISPELSERFKALPGLEGKTHAERLAALCELWEQEHTSLPEQKSSSPETAPADPISEASDPYTALLQQLDSFSAELAAEDAAEAAEPVIGSPARLSLWDTPLPNVPPLPEKSYYPALEKALIRLYEQEWPRRKHGNTEDAKRWKYVLRSEPAVLTAFRAMTTYKEHLGDLIRHCCLGIGPNDLLAWFELEEADRRAVLWYLVHAGTIYPEALGEVGKRFQQAKAAQPKRNFLSWELESKS